MKLAIALIVAGVLTIDAYPLAALALTALACLLGLWPHLTRPAPQAYEVKRATQLRYVPPASDDETLAVPAYWRRPR